MKKRAVCRCGVWETAHREGRGCDSYRKAGSIRRWRLDHVPWHHVTGRIWLGLSEKRRWKVVGWLHDRRPESCWCDLVDAAYLDIKRDDYECGCEVPLPLPLQAPREGWCYCPPSSETAEPSGS